MVVRLNDLLLCLNNDENWRKILGKPKLDRRQKDVGYVLRCMSLFHNYRQYKKTNARFSIRIYAQKPKSLRQIP